MYKYGYAYMFYVRTCGNISDKSSVWSVFLSFCFKLIDLLFFNFMQSLDFCFYLYYIFVDLN